MSLAARKLEMDVMAPQVGAYRYRLKDTGASSVNLGRCQVCASDVERVFHQVEERYEEQPLPGGMVFGTWTTHGCRHLFGHESCLVAKRRDADMRV